MEKDITTKGLLEQNDVFADVANVNLFDGKQFLSPEDLESVPIDSSYKDLDGTHHMLFRDCLKKVNKLGGCIAFIGYENQTGINNAMPVRDMGYTYTAYRKQIQEITAKNRREHHNAYAKVLHDDQKLVPVATFVLYFGTDKWTTPLSLMDLLDIPAEEKPFWENLIENYHIRVIHMANQPKEIREKYQSDYGIIADYLAYAKNKKELEKHLCQDKRRIIHVEQLLDMLRTISGDERFEMIKETYIEKEYKEECNMCLLLDMCETKGVEKGKNIGREEGRNIGREEGRSIGREEGRSIGREEGLVIALKNLMETLNLTAENAMDALKIPQENRSDYASKLH